MTIHLRDVEVDGSLTNVTVDGDAIAEIGRHVRPRPGARLIDGAGGALLPGLHDHHIHLTALAAARSSIDVGPPAVRHRDELATTLASADGTRPGGEWIRAVGYNERVVGELDRWFLDRAVPDRPVRVQHRSGALWVLNSKALECLGLLEGSQPEGCEVLADGTPTGRLWRLDRWLGAARADGAPDLAPVGRELLRLGVTGVTDMTPYEDATDLAAIDEAVQSGALPQRVTVTGAPELDPRAVPASLQFGPAKVLLADHDLPSLDALTARLRAARAFGRPVAVHCVTRVSLVLTLAAFDDVGTVPGDRIEHGAVIPRELDAALRSSGLTVVTQPNLVAERGDDYLESVDPEDLPDLWRCASLIEAGVSVAAGTDAPFGGIDPWSLVAAAAERRTEGGAVLDAQERLEPRRALSLLLGPPDAPGGPERRITAGAPADVCLLGAPLREALASGGNPVRGVIRAGHVVHGNLD